MRGSVTAGVASAVKPSAATNCFRASGSHAGYVYPVASVAIQALTGRCDEQYAALPFFPFIEVLTSPGIVPLQPCARTLLPASPSWAGSCRCSCRCRRTSRCTTLVCDCYTPWPASSRPWLPKDRLPCCSTTCSGQTVPLWSCSCTLPAPSGETECYCSAPSGTWRWAARIPWSARSLS